MLSNQKTNNKRKNNTTVAAAALAIATVALTAAAIGPLVAMTSTASAAEPNGGNSDTGQCARTAAQANQGTNQMSGENPAEICSAVAAALA